MFRGVLIIEGFEISWMKWITVRLVDGPVGLPDELCPVHDIDQGFAREGKLDEAMRSYEPRKGDAQ